MYKNCNFFAFFPLYKLAQVQGPNWRYIFEILVYFYLFCLLFSLLFSLSEVIFKTGWVARLLSRVGKSGTIHFLWMNLFTFMKKRHLTFFFIISNFRTFNFKTTNIFFAMLTECLFDILTILLEIYKWFR